MGDWVALLEALEALDSDVEPSPLVRHCTRAIVKNRKGKRHSWKDSLAICRGAAKRNGHVDSSGQPTGARGRELDQKHRTEPDSDKKDKDFNRAAKKFALR